MIRRYFQKNNFSFINNELKIYFLACGWRAVGMEPACG
jgi:hypothetical protein